MSYSNADRVRIANAARALPLPFRQKLGFASGALVEGTALHPLNIFLLFYATVVCGMPAAQVGFAIFVGLVIDAFLDPLIGSKSDHHQSKFGRRIPFMLIGTPLVAFSFILVFSLPVGWGEAALLAWLTVSHAMLRISVSLVALPHLALASELSDDYVERSSILTWRWLFFILGAIIGTLLGFAAFFAGPDGLENRDAYRPFAMALAVLIVAGGLTTCWTALKTRAREHGAPSESRSGLRVFHDLKEVFSNRTFRVLFAVTLLFFIGFGVSTVLQLHTNTYFWRLTSAQTQSVTLALFFGLFLGAPLAGPLLKRFEKRDVGVAMLCGVLLVQTLPVLMRLAGFFPFEGSAVAAVLTGLNIAYGAMLGAAAVATNSMGPDALDEHELLFDQRREGIFSAGNAFANKAASGAGSLIAGLALQFIGFPSQDPHSSATLQVADQTANMLALVYGPGSAMISLLAVLILMRYQIDRKTHEGIMVALRERPSRQSG